MKSVLYVVFGADGHRQRESFNRSCKFNTEQAEVEIFNAEACRNYGKHAEDLQDLQEQLRADAEGMTYPELSYLE